MKLFDHVRIKSTGVTGIIVDILNGCYTVEADNERKNGDKSGYPGRWPLYTCTISEIEAIEV